MPAKGRAYREVEELPRDQEALEAVVVDKFVATLRERYAIDLTNLRRAAEPADIVATAGEQDWQIQVVEAIDQDARRLAEMRSGYLAAIRESPEVVSLFSGCRVALVDLGDPPYLPRASSRGGAPCIDHLLAGAVRVASEIAGLPVGKVRRIDVQVCDRRVSFLVTRHEAPSDPCRVHFEWQGGGPSFRVDMPRGILPAAVDAKIRKRYAKPEGRFVLLVYSVDTLCDRNDPDMTAARDLLNSVESPFDEVWYFYPLADREVGFAKRVWTADDRGAI